MKKVIIIIVKDERTHGDVFESVFFAKNEEDAKQIADRQVNSEWDQLSKFDKKGVSSLFATAHKISIPEDAEDFTAEELYKSIIYGDIECTEYEPFGCDFGKEIYVTADMAETAEVIRDLCRDSDELRDFIIDYFKGDGLRFSEFQKLNSVDAVSEIIDDLNEFKSRWEEERCKEKGQPEEQDERLDEIVDECAEEICRTADRYLN